MVRITEKNENYTAGASDRFSLTSFYRGDYFELDDADSFSFAASRDELIELKDLIDLMLKETR